MRTLVFGAKGQLGRDLLGVFDEEGETAGADLPEADITVEQSVVEQIETFRPDLVVNAAAYTDVEAAEDNADAAFLVNETGAGNVARAATHADVPLVYISTDYVFDGTKSTPYEPDDPVSPLDVYARSKEAGERATRQGNPRYFIIRTAWLYGPGGNSFVEKILRAAASRPSLKVVDDEVGSPTHTLDLAQATLALSRTDAYGTYHAVNAGSCSRFEFAREIVRLAELHTPLTPCASTEFPTKARRPMCSVLDTTTLEHATGYEMRPWKEALEHYMTRREPVGRQEQT